MYRANSYLPLLEYVNGGQDRATLMEDKEFEKKLNSAFFRIVDDIRDEFPGLVYNNHNGYKINKENFDLCLKDENYKKDPKSIYLYFEKEPGMESACIYVCLSINPTVLAQKEECDKYYRFLDCGIDRDYLRYVMHYNMGHRKWNVKRYHEINTEDITDKEQAYQWLEREGQNCNIELCYLVVFDKKKKEEEISNEVRKAVKMLLPYYEYVLGIKSLEETREIIAINDVEDSFFTESENVPEKEMVPEGEEKTLEEENNLKEKTISKSEDLESENPESKDYESEKRSSRESQFDHNLILYGPPGTGKTYKTVTYAVAICNGEDVKKLETYGYENIKSRYDSLKKENRICFTTFHQSYNYEDFVEGIRPVLDEDQASGKKDDDSVAGNSSSQIKYKMEKGIFRKFCEEYAAKHREKNFVFIIDELNRGNVSQIFGELMTLIETSKRDTASVVLPGSRVEFSVPSNVYIIGTMNTADRSLAALDAAFRRRFSFKEIMPRPETLREMKADKVEYEDENGQTGVIDIVEMLKLINRRIEFLYDRDHTIGHAYFNEMCGEKATMENLEKAFRNKIFPLLQEYFFDDYAKIHMILGDNGKPSKYQFVQKKYLKKSGTPQADEYENPFLDDYDRTGYTEDIYELPEVYYEINWEAFGNPISYRHIYEKYI